MHTRVKEGVDRTMNDRGRWQIREKSKEEKERQCERERMQTLQSACERGCEWKSDRATES